MSTKDYTVSFLNYRESFNGFDHDHGWATYQVYAKNDESARKKARKLWRQEYGKLGFWVQNTSTIRK